MSTPVLRNRAEPTAEERQWRALALLMVASALIGIAQAVVWAHIAPGQHVVYQNSAALSVPTESLHRFASIAIFLLLEIAVAVTISSAAWRWRAARGTAMLLSVVLANAVGALIAYLLGRDIAPGVDLATVGPSAADQLVLVKPVLGSAILIVAQPALAAVVYTFLVAWNGDPTLGRTDQPVAGADVSLISGPAAPSSTDRDSPTSAESQRPDRAAEMPQTDPSPEARQP